MVIPLPSFRATAPGRRQGPGGTIAAARSGSAGSRWWGGRAAFLTVELVVAMAILMAALFPLSYAFLHERRLALACYYRAIATEIVDGELEVLRADPARAGADGSHPFAVRAESAANLPPGRFTLSRDGRRLRWEWRPDKRGRGGPVVREVTLP